MQIHEIHSFGQNIPTSNQAKLKFNKKVALVLWLKVPYYSCEILFIKVYRVSLKILSVVAISSKLKRGLNIHSQRMYYYQIHIGEKGNSIFSRYKYKDYLINTVRNIPKFSVLYHDQDLSEAKKIISNLKEKFENDLVSINHNNLEDLKPYSDLISKLTPPVQSLKKSTGGVCFASVFDYASQYFRNHKSWKSISEGYERGSGARVAALQSLYASSIHVLRHIEDYMGSFFGIALSSVNEIKPSYSDQKNIENLTKLSEGVYKLTFTAKGGVHAFLLSKDSHDFQIIDPNIGLLECSHQKVAQLLKKFFEDYSKRKGFSSHKIDLQQMTTTDLQWKFFKDNDGIIRFGLR